MRLSKSQYIQGLQCHKALWLRQHKPELRAEPDQNRLAIFAAGHEIGELAKELFPGGTEIEFDAGDFDGMVEKTARLIDDGAKVIYEATFRANNVLIMADILVRNGASWDFYEVKSSTGLKPYHKHDAAIQWFVLSRHLPLDKAHIVHVNNRYVFEDKLDVGQLLTIEDITEKVKALQDGIEANLGSMAQMLGGDEPDIPIGPHCKKPFECDFKTYCWQIVPNPSVLDLYKINGIKAFELFHQNIVNYADLQDLDLTATQSLQVKSTLSGEVYFDQHQLGDFIRDANYPINFLDFETFKHVVPKFNGQRPHMAMPFQYSLHILHEDGLLEHKEYLADEASDPRAGIAAQLVKDITPTGSIVAHNQSTEIGVINKLASEFPEHEATLRAMPDRFIDLLKVFRGLMYYHPDFNGDFSIKSILPAMFPNDTDSDYKELEVQDGRMAMNIYANLPNIENADERQEIKESLLEYCKLDTLAMVKIWQALKGMTH